MIQVEVSGTEALRAKLQRIGAVLTRQALAGAAVELEQYIEGEAAKHHKTGALVRSVYKARTPDGWFIGHDQQHAPHARFVIEGTRPHLIRPKTGGTYFAYKDMDGKAVKKGIAKGGRGRTTLRWAMGGKFIFAKEVKHPGYKGDNYLQRAAALAPAVFERHVNQKLSTL